MSEHEAVSKPHLAAGTYDTFRDSALLYLPGLATLYFTLAQFWNLPYPEQIVGTIAALTVFLGITVKKSKSNFLKSPEGQVPTGPSDGAMVVTSYEDGDTIRFAPDLDLEELKAKDQVVLTVQRQKGVEGTPSQ
jgi:hypothetical protein